MRQIFIMIVRHGQSLFVHVTAQDRVRERIAHGMRLPAAVDKRVLVLRCRDGVHHDFQIAARGVFHAHGDAQTACRQSMLLVLDGTRAYGDVGQQVVEVLMIFRIEHFLRAGKACLVQGAHVELADGDDTLEQIRFI